MVVTGAPGSLLSNAEPPHTHRAGGSALCPAFWGAWLKGAVGGQCWDEAHPMLEGKTKCNAEISFSLTSQAKLGNDLQGTVPRLLGKRKGGS